MAAQVLSARLGPASPREPGPLLPSQPRLPTCPMGAPAHLVLVLWEALLHTPMQLLEGEAHGRRAAPHGAHDGIHDGPQVAHQQPQAGLPHMLLGGCALEGEPPAGANGVTVTEPSRCPPSTAPTGSDSAHLPTPPPQPPLLHSHGSSLLRKHRQLILVWEPSCVLFPLPGTFLSPHSAKMSLPQRGHPQTLKMHFSMDTPDTRFHPRAFARAIALPAHDFLSPLPQVLALMSPSCEAVPVATPMEPRKPLPCFWHFPRPSPASFSSITLIICRKLLL